MWDKVAAKFLDENSKARVANQLNLTGEDYSKYRDAVDNGDILLLVRTEEDKIKQTEDNAGELITQDDVLKAQETHTDQPMQLEDINHPGQSENSKSAKENMTAIWMLHKLFMKTATDAPLNWKVNHLRSLI